MSYFVWTVFAGILGWGASLVMRSNVSNHHLLHASIGVTGALLGGWLMSTPLRVALESVDDISILSFLVSFFIALALSMMANLWDRVRTMDDIEVDF